MRAFLRRTQVLLVVAALVVPVFVAGDTAAASTPICCLGKGEHHCLGQMLGSGGTSPGLSAAIAKCPYSPLALAAMHGPELAPPARAQAILAISQRAAVTLKSKASASTTAVLARAERGPPFSSLS